MTLADDRRLKLRRALGRLIVYGVEPWWVREVGGALLELKQVAGRASTEEGSSARVDALVDVLRDIVRKMGQTPSGVLLRIVLGLDDQYLGKSALERRTLAGEQFRGGRRRVGAGTIRQYHEPKALDALVEALLAEEGRQRSERALPTPPSPRSATAARLGLVDRADLLRWAESLSARGDLPRLVRRLILETAPSVVTLGFPAGEGITTAGWDGIVLAREATAFVPAGRSLWELSAEKSAENKATKDYSKRLVTPDGSPTSDCAYVAVSLRNWPTRGEWARDREAEGRWKTVRALGADDLEAWLETAPVTHAWLSELLGLHPYGFTTSETWWKTWGAATSPPLPAPVLLAGRTAAADVLRAKLSGPGQIVTIAGASREDVLAFFAAFVMAEAEADGRVLRARVAFVDRVEAWRRLREHQLPLVLVAVSQDVAADFGPGSPHCLIVPIFDAGSADITLPPIDSQVVKVLLESAEPKVPDADEIAQLARLSLLAARRRIAIKPELHRPAWAKAPAARLVRRVVLAGRWNENSVGDRAILDSLLGTPYDSLGDDIAALTSGGDPLLVRLGSAMGVVSHVDAWLLVSSHLRKEDLELFHKVALEVLGEVNPALEFNSEDHWRASLLGKERSYSTELRLGLASTLALLGARGESQVLGSDLTGEDWATWIVGQLLESANADRTCLLWRSLGDVLPLLAEAAPSQFLKAVRAGLMPEPPILSGMFRDNFNGNALSIDSAHSNLLWALETCAWSPAEFGQAVDLLARLAEIDPGGRLTNRPMASLEAIFCPWYPQNNVSPARRLAALDGLRDRHEAVAWMLMILMLPEQHGIAMPTYEPRFRNWKPERIVMTTQEYRSFVEEICYRLLQSVGLDAARWKQLIDGFANLPPSIRTDMLAQLESLASGGGLDPGARGQIWESLRSTAAHHREFTEASWALPSNEVARIERVATCFEPSAPVERFSWLFDEHMPEIADIRRDDLDTYSNALAGRRTQAAQEISKDLDWSRLYSFALKRRLPWCFGLALGQAGAVGFEDQILALLKSDHPPDLELARGFVNARFRLEGWQWIDSCRRAQQLTPKQEAWLLLETDDFPNAWEVAEVAGLDVSALFWSHFRTSGRGADFPYANFVAQKLLEVGRAAGALDLLALYSQGEPDTERAGLMASGLEQLLRSSDEGNHELSFLGQFGLRTIFSYLERSSLPRERLAKLEWAYLHVFGYDTSLPTLSQYLAQDAGFFVDVISQVYRPRPPEGADDENAAISEEIEPTEKQRSIASNAYRLLSQWRTLPGLQRAGTVDREALFNWVAEARRRLAEVHRLKVGDIHIGHVLASSPTDPDGHWPAIAVRDLLEFLQSPEVENGLGTQLYNNRGPTWRGLLDGGDQERILVAHYREQAEGLVDRWPRIASALNELADTYEREARRHEGDAERRRRGFES